MNENKKISPIIFVLRKKKKKKRKKNRSLIFLCPIARKLVTREKKMNLDSFFFLASAIWNNTLFANCPYLPMRPKYSFFLFNGACVICVGMEM